MERYVDYWGWYVGYDCCLLYCIFVGFVVGFVCVDVGIVVVGFGGLVGNWLVVRYVFVRICVVLFDFE